MAPWARRSSSSAVVHCLVIVLPQANNSLFVFVQAILIKCNGVCMHMCAYTHTKDRDRDGDREGEEAGGKEGLGLGCSSSGDEDGRSHGRRGGSTLVVEPISGIHWMTDFFSQIRKYTRYSSCATSQTTTVWWGSCSLDQLLSLPMAWSNHLFLSHSYVTF